MTKFEKFLKVIGIISFSFFIIIIVTIIASTIISTPSFRINTCTSNQKQIIQSTLIYMAEHEEKLPGKDFWSVANIDKELLRCPDAGKRVANPYAYNELLANVEIEKMADPVSTIMLADSDNDNNLMSASKDVAIRHTKKTKAVIAFVAGHVILTDDFRNVKFKNELKKEEKKP